MARVVGLILELNDEFAQIQVSYAGVTENNYVIRNTPGFVELIGGHVGGHVKVEVELIPPRTSTLTHLVINEIIDLVNPPHQPMSLRDHENLRPDPHPPIA